jgi:hypothetical protein
MTTTLRRIRVTLGLKPKNYPHLLARAKAIYNAMLANANLFPNPTPTMAVLLALITSFDSAQQATATKAKGTAPARNAKAALVVTALESEETYVQGLCDASPEQAVELIASAAMLAADVPEHDKVLLASKLIPGQPGSVQLVANASMLTGGSRKRPTFNWTGSIDGGKTWPYSQSTPHANTVLASIPLGSTLQVRVSVTLGKVVGEWSQPVSIVVQ